ncbi:hypothetical protein DFH28DRAFT_982501, partial [Melampsora americana]
MKCLCFLILLCSSVIPFLIFICKNWCFDVFLCSIWLFSTKKLFFFMVFVCLESRKF